MNSFSLMLSIATYNQDAAEGATMIIFYHVVFEKKKYATFFKIQIRIFYVPSKEFL